MEFLDFAARMWPLWMLGIFMLYSTAKSEHKELLKINKKAIFKWTLFLLALTIYRLCIFYFFKDTDTLKNNLQAVSFIPWQVTLTVFWEDACHGLPIVLVQRLISGKWFAKPVNLLMMLCIMLSFGLGHTYQGSWAAALLALYVPFTVKKGKELGFGTVMICHVLYDLFTVIAVKWALGL